MLLDVLLFEEVQYYRCYQLFGDDRAQDRVAVILLVRFEQLDSLAQRVVAGLVVFDEFHL